MEEKKKYTIKELRKKHNMTQRELGEKLGVSYARVSVIEKNTQVLSLYNIRKIADIFDVSVDQIK